ncbi:NAD(+) diphosphatase [Aureimonas mangrovi]|uniref:NAD(+) diphosphatase n=1 Tax=Aureimonas mangrovi TaxID=2758041 RepID=UPI00163DCCD3|nr:NAD(+) diphosphatase [Aureimonas mangrovi]
MSRALGFTANTLIRLAEERDGDTLAKALGHPAARFYLSGEGRFLARGAEEAPEPAFTLDEARRLGVNETEATLLGWTPGSHEPRFAAALPGGFAPEEGSLLDLRTLGMRGLLSPDIEGQLAQALHFLNWHHRTRFCGVCGGRTTPEHAGYRRRCLECGTHHFPRTDPVVIMLVRDGQGRGLLGRQHHFAPGMWSCLAGFLEPGETLEDAVRRETQEESGISVGAVAYVASQPWPFPGSLMIGCVGEALTTDISVQDSELEDCRWFEPDEMRAMLSRSHADGLFMPPDYAIANTLIRQTCGG